MIVEMVGMDGMKNMYEKDAYFVKEWKANKEE